MVLRESGYSLVQISAAGVLFLPWGLKFLWAPYVDRYGTRRRWLLTLQSAAAAIALALSFLDLSSTLQWLFLGIFVMNAVSATQDIATDGIAVRTLSVAQRGLGGFVCNGRKVERKLVGLEPLAHHPVNDGPVGQSPVPKGPVELLVPLPAGRKVWVVPVGPEG